MIQFIKATGLVALPWVIRFSPAFSTLNPAFKTLPLYYCWRIRVLSAQWVNRNVPVVVSVAHLLARCYDAKVQIHCECDVQPLFGS